MDKLYRLDKNEDTDWYPYLDQDGVSHNSPDQWFWIAILGGCGCGQSDTFAEQASKLLAYFGQDDKDYHTLTDTEELLAHWFDSNDLLEHGTHIHGSWLTDKGKNILGEIQKYD